MLRRVSNASKGGRVLGPCDIRLAKGNPDAVFTAIHPNFYSDAAPYLLTVVDLPPTNPKVERGSGGRLPIGPLEEEQALAKKSSDPRQLSIGVGMGPPIGVQKGPL